MTSAVWGLWYLYTGVVPGAGAMSMPPCAWGCGAGTRACENGALFESGLNAGEEGGGGDLVPLEPTSRALAQTD